MRTVSALLAIPLLLLSACGTDASDARKQSAANLVGIVKAANVSAVSEGDRFPDHIGVLIAGRVVAAKQLINPRGASTAAEFTLDELDAANNYVFTVYHGASGGPHPEAIIPLKAAWDSVKERIDQHNDYVLATSGMKGEFLDQPQIILAWEKPDGMKDGINVAFADTQVRFISLADLSAAFEANNTARQEKKQPLITLKDGFPVAPKSNLPPPP